jgi:nicotinate-nucleotide--dimethylbenzimidazole phosphoribosyltransferase
MTDTGQIPAEGLPENAGMVEQPGVPAHGAYTYLSETTAEDEDLLLLPGAQGAWGNEVPPPAPEPVVETVHEPGPHETAGRDSGSVDLGGVRLPEAPPAPVTPRRPLHLGPPLPDTSASPVRSLADRGPAGAPVRQPGPPTTGPEYLDAPQLRDLPPQGAAPWGAQAPVSAGVQTAETVVPVGEPSAEPGSAAQAVDGETGSVATAVDAGPTAAPEQGMAQAPDAGEAWQGHGQLYAAETAVSVPSPHASTETSGTAGAPETGQLPEGAEESVAGQQAYGQDSEAGYAPDGGHGVEAGYAPEDGGAAEGAFAVGTGPVPEDASVVGAGQVPEDAFAVDGGQVPEQFAAPVAWQVQDGAVAPAADPVPVDVDGSATVPGADVASGTSGTEEAFASDAGPMPEAVGVTGAGEGVAAGFAAGNEPGAEALGAEALLDHGVQPGFEAGLGHGVAPGSEAVSAQGAGQAPEDAVAVTFAPDPEQAPVAAHPQETAPLDGAGHVPDVGQTPPVPAVPAGVEALPTPEAGSFAVAAPDVAQAAFTADDPAPLTEVTSMAVHPTPDPDAAHPDSAATPAEAEAVPDPQFAAEAESAPAPEPAVAEGHGTEAAETRLPLAAETHLPLAAEPHPLAGPQTHPVGPEGIQLAQPAALEAEFTEPPHAFPAEPQPDDSLGRFVPVAGSVPTTPHLAPTSPHPLTLPTEEPQGGEGTFAVVPGPREAHPVPAGEHDPELVQHADDLDTRAADQEEESTAVVEDVRESTGPAAPGYDDAEREAVLKVMRERRDIRNGFRSDPIPHDVLLRVLEAAHTAPSVGHSQPWDFVVIRSADTRRGMHELAQRQREAYAKSLPKGRAKQFKELKIEAILDTPVNIVVTADPTRGGRHTLGRHTQPQMAPYSAALAVENLWLAARAEGLGVGWVSFFDEREMVRALGLPEHLEVIAYLCVGYVDEFPDEPELMQAGWSKRRPLSWVVHEETYGRRALPGEDPHDLLAETVAGIRPLDAKALGEAWERQKRMTKPPGSLGMLEIISAQLSGLSRQCPPPIPEPAAVAIFAGDHGVHAQGVTPWPQEVTAQMVANFLGGGAVCNAFAGQVGAEVCVVDVGVAAELPATPGLLPRKIRAGTSDMTTGPAMSREEAKQAIEVGIETARDLVAAGNKALLTGEMGIANTTASAALISVFTDTDPAEVTGRGTGINDETLARKTEVVRRAIELHQPDPADPIGVLAAIGGFEHAAMVGLLLGGASLRTPVILDGVSAGAAALVARAIAPEVLAACIAGHRSAEPGHVAALNKLGLRPLVDLDLRLGEGTGALLALPLVQSTARAMHEVATFDSAGVTEK